jgi:hypothetical protein
MGTRPLSPSDHGLLPRSTRRFFEATPLSKFVGFSHHRSRHPRPCPRLPSSVLVRADMIRDANGSLPGEPLVFHHRPPLPHQGAALSVYTGCTVGRESTGKRRNARTGDLGRTDRRGPGRLACGEVGRDRHGRLHAARIPHRGRPLPGLCRDVRGRGDAGGEATPSGPGPTSATRTRRSGSGTPRAPGGGRRSGPVPAPGSRSWKSSTDSLGPRRWRARSRLKRSGS